MAPSAINLPQCGAPPPELLILDDVDDDQRRANPELPHDYRCNQGLHTKSEIDKSRKEFNWKVVEPFDGEAANEWVSWDSIGLDVEDDRHRVQWRNCSDLHHSWTGLVKLDPGQTEPYHKHTPPMFYYILQGQPLVTLNGIKNRTKKWQCVNIPSLCPHAIHNDTNEEVVVLWNYVSLTDKVRIPRFSNILLMISFFRFIQIRISTGFG